MKKDELKKRKRISVSERLIELDLKRRRLQKEANDLDRQIQELGVESERFLDFDEIFKN